MHLYTSKAKKHFFKNFNLQEPKENQSRIILRKDV